MKCSNINKFASRYDAYQSEYYMVNLNTGKRVDTKLGVVTTILLFLCMLTTPIIGCLALYFHW